MIIIGDDNEEIANLKNLLHSEFKVKDLRKLNYVLGMEIARCKSGTVISQRKYTLDLTKEIGKLGSRPTSTPLEKNRKHKVSKDDPPINKESYQRLIGKLIYLSLTRPNIAYSVSVVSQFMYALTKRHQDAVD